ncbi:PREDICTED: probable transcription factor At3g04930 [Tarenaya hassleriana]|uniref:probable transcription factor At3g04930 n=1 Tax=Tarenaya hassleriana TaxID=28532 RepID=UPI00053C195B|nr:PREDICTED: probable transcription factor At3g04930 [Tarenaya hassleriana]
MDEAKGKDPSPLLALCPESRVEISSRNFGSSDSDEDLRENDDVVIPEGNDADEDDPEEDLNSPSTSSLAVVSAVSTATAVISGAEAMASPTAAVTVALPAGSAVAVAAIPVDSDQKWHHMTEIVQQRAALDDSRRLFQRLWTDEDEIELLRGFLEYMTTHRGSSSHPPDTAPFYEQIKSKLQLDFNKNQLVEKLRRLKKKYRNVMSKINSGKEVFFKSPHDQATFEISKKIWSHTGKIIGFEDNNVLDFEETNNHHLQHQHHVNTTNGNSTFNNPSANLNMEIDAENGFEKKATMSNSSGSRKRSRSRIGKMEEDKPITPCDGHVPNAASNINLNENVTGAGGNLAGLIEETVKNCVSPIIKEMMNGTTAMMMAAVGGLPGAGGHGLGTLSLSPITMPPLNLGIGGGGGKGIMDERWRRQQMLELEVYSRRLELVQEQIRVALHELRTMPSSGGGG